jgi:hypothetical protein
MHRGQCVEPASTCAAPAPPKKASPQRQMGGAFARL